MRRKITPMLTGGVLGSKAVSLGDLDEFMDWLVSGDGGADAQELYAAVSWSFWCANLRASSLASVPFGIYPLELPKDEEDEGNQIEWPYPLETLLWDTEAWMTLVGAAYWLKKAKRNQLQGLRILNANTMKVKSYDEDGPVTFEQRIGAERRIFPAEQIVYFRTFNPKDDINRGVSGGHVGQVAGELVYNANRWASKFFENGALPAVILTTEGNVPKSEKERIQNVWEKMLQGVRNAFKTVVLEQGLIPTVIGTPISDLAMPDLEETKRHQILAAHNIPPGLGDVKTNRAERDALQWEFWTFSVVPYMRTRIVPVLNEQLFEPLGLRIAFHYNEVEAIQRAEIEKGEQSAFVVSGVVIPGYEAGLVGQKEARGVIDTVLQMVNMPGLEEEIPDDLYEPPEPVPFGGGGGDSGGGEGTISDPGENIQNRAAPKALAPEWGRLMVSSES
jgi:HK97 family phage portal protein